MTDTTCPPGCGACCDPVRLQFRTEDMEGPSGSFAREHWHEIPELGDYDVNGKYFHAYRCDVFDPHTRTCTAYADRPPICSGYPWYGAQPDRERVLDPWCAYQADVRPMLPIVGVTHGR